MVAGVIAGNISAEGATRVAKEVSLAAQSCGDECQSGCSRERTDLTWCSAIREPTGCGGIREEPSKAPGQCNPAQAAESIRETRFRSLPAISRRGARLGGRVNACELLKLSLR